MRRSVAVIGGGPAGLAAAVRAIDRGAACVLYEAGAEVGGLARTIELDGIRTDVGPHVFSGGPPEAAAMWQRFIGETFAVPLRRGILRHAVVLDHPPRPTDLLRSLSVVELAACGFGAVRARWITRPPAGGDTESWIVSRYGRALYDVVARPYVEKLWGRPGSELDEGFAHSLFREADRVSAQAPSKSTTFQFPVGGTSSVWSRMADAIRSGGSLRLRAPVDGIRPDGAAHVISSKGTDERFDVVVSTLPPARLAAALDAPENVRIATEALVTRHILMVHLVIEGGPSLDRSWIFVADRDFAVGRISDSRTWTGRPSAGILAMEFWCGDQDAIWQADEETVIARARQELDHSGLLSGGRLGAARVTRLRGALPVPTLGTPRRLATVREFVDAHPGLFTIGRHGGFSFNSMAESMAEGIRAADQALGS